MQEKKEALDLLFANLDIGEGLNQLKQDITKEEPLISDKNDVETEDLISTKNSDNALPDELAKEDGVPISTVDPLETHELISSHNSERALTSVEHKPFTDTEEINVLSTHNSSKFVDSNLN